MAKIPLTQEQADNSHAFIRREIDRIQSADPTVPISPLWIAALGKDYYFEDDPPPSAAPTWTRISYNEYIKSPEWKMKADAAKARAGYKCQTCNSTKYLNAHHRTYERLGHELDSDITVLCRECHEIFSKNGKLAR